MPTTILASRFNNLKVRVDKILGPCLETNPNNASTYLFGYGQSLGAGVNQSSSNDTIDALAYKLLYINIQKIRYHQVGTAAFSAEAYKVGDFVTNASADKVEEAYINGLETLATNMENDKFLLHSTQADLTFQGDSTSAPTWNGSLSHIFTVTFTSAQERREFFNAGGLIRIIPGMTYTGSQAKTLDWKAMLNAIGPVNYGCQSTIAPSGVGQSYGGIGHDYMTSSYQRGYYNMGGGVYNPNEYTIFIMELSDTVLQFKCEFNDPAYGNPDESVVARAVNTVQFYTPNGTAQIDGTSTITVQKTAPTYSLISNL